MKKAVRKGASKAAALVLSLAMIFGMVPLVGASAEETAGAQDNFDRIVHLDMGRKYFTPEWIKSLIDEMAKLGYNQLELDFGNSEAGQLRFALGDMSVTYTYDEYTMVPVDSVSEEEPAAPAGTGAPEEEPAAPAETGAPEEEPAAPVSDEVLEQAETNGNGSGVIEYTYINEPVEVTVDLSKALSSESPEGEYITEEQMAEIITYAKEKDIEIVPLLNSPGHFGAVLCAADAAGKNYRYQRYGQGTNSLNIADPEARAFGLAVVKKYAEWFKEKGCDTFNIGADEFANDDGIMGFNEFGDEMWSYFDTYITGLYNMLTDGLGYTTVRMFNDGVNYGPDYGYGYKHTSNIPRDIQICYWSSGWGGYDVASASELASQYSLINTNGAYYFVLKDGTMEYKSEEECLSFANESFMGGTVSSSAGSMFCIWCDEPDNASQEEIMEAVKGPMTAVAYQMQGGESGTGMTYKQFKLSAVDSVTDGATGVTVSVDGVESVKVQKTEVAGLSDSPLYSDYAAYDITLNGGAYKGEAQVTIPLSGALSSAEHLVGFVVESNGAVTTFDGVKSGNSFTFTAPHFSVVGVAALNESYDEEKPVTVVVHGTETVDVSGVNLAGSYATANPGIATVTVTGEDGTEGSVDYERAYNVSCNQLISGDSDRWQSTGRYYRADDGNYYPLYAKRSSEWQAIWTKYTYTWGYSTTASGNNVTQIGTQETEFFNRNPDVNITIYTQHGEPGTPASTTITFHGLAEGQTYVVIGGTRYNITVTAEDLSHVTPLTVEYWITNARVNGSSGQQQAVISAEDAYSESGVNIATLVDAEGIRADDANAHLVFWKGTVLDYNHHQSGNGSDDETANGADFTYIRYWNGAWQYRNSSGAWENIQTTGNRRDQVVAYYLQRTTVTDEVETLTKDWGYTYDNVENHQDGDVGQVALSFAVVYPSGQIRPAEENFYTDSTTIFNWNDDWGDSGYPRNIGIISPQNNAEYEISKITLTYGTRDYNNWRGDGYTNAQYWTRDESITWEKYYDEEAGVERYNETVAWDKSYGTEPVVYGSHEEGHYWKARNTAILVLIYLDPVETEESLHVNYQVEGENTPFYDYPIQANETFLTGLTQRSDVHAGDFTLDDGAYILNTNDNPEYILKTLTTIPALVGTIYGSGLYTYVRATLSDDGKTLTLYYSMDAATDYQYVVDYGLPVRVPVTDLGITEVSSIQSINVTNGIYGEVTVSGDNAYFTYTPNNFMNRVDSVIVRLNFSDNETQRVAVSFIPASTVYYEAEDFVTSTWKLAGEFGNRTQAADKLGASANNYGSDPSYDSNALGSSNGAALTTEVKPTGEGEGTTWPKATFTFTGTGVDIISQTDSASTWLLVEVKNDKSEPECAYLVNNYYSAVNRDVDTIYQVPVIKVQGLDYGTYNVTVKPFYDTNEKQTLAVEGQTATEFNFYLDAIRVYNPLGENGDTYYDRDGEANAQFINLSKYVTSTTGNGLWVDGDPNAVVDPTYKDDGPNNEIYLASGQSVTIKLVDSEGKPIAVTAGKSAQIGARLISGTEAKISVGANSIPVNSTVDQYYEVTGGVDSEITITNTGSGSGIVALTTLKLTDGSN